MRYTCTNCRRRFSARNRTQASLTSQENAGKISYLRYCPFCLPGRVRLERTSSCGKHGHIRRTRKGSRYLKITYCQFDKQNQRHDSEESSGTHDLKSVGGIRNMIYKDSEFSSGFDAMPYKRNDGNNCNNSNKKCCICNKKFKRKSHLNNHLVNAHGRRRTMQNGNGYGSPTNGNRTAAEVTDNCKGDMSASQTYQKLYKCSVCDKAFDNEYQVKLHGEIHTETQGYVCAFCNKTYKCQSDLKIHQEKHKYTSRSYHKCPHCAKPFEMNYDLQKHIERFHGGGKKINMHECRVCGKAFNRRKSLAVHKKKHCCA